ncbi:non-hydrolyzing UDP-N-acetylglucosamine 2-epimerase [Microbacterium sp. NPDC089695]|uniref:non-hydrolyzing UDP-N-acetylglucosamine 2-epimerase n=1 Tax=Microbacterium sp. NPDC089695 TaxID=3364198 RepID=UPI003803FB72
MATKSIAVVLGTRPEIIKLAPVIRELGERAWVIHTGQHYDAKMSGQFFEQFGIGAPDVILEGIGGANRGTQISAALQALTDLFLKNRPSAVIVQGDTNAVSAGAQAANYLGIPLIHVEAGLRSYDRAMPEELNRLVVGALADVHCAATDLNARNLLGEGVDPARVIVTGNTVVEATLASLEQGDGMIGRHFPSGIAPEKFVLATIHRPENTDSPDALERVLRGLTAIELPVVLLTHPRTRLAAERFGLTDFFDELHAIESVGHSELLDLAQAATLLVSDSGGLQEETTVLGKPLLVVRRSTERPEAVDAGFARLITPDKNIAREAAEVLENNGFGTDLRTAQSPYGDGTASRTIATIAAHIDNGHAPAQAIALVEASHDLAA